MVQSHLYCVALATFLLLLHRFSSSSRCHHRARLLLSQLHLSAISKMLRFPIYTRTLTLTFLRRRDIQRDPWLSHASSNPHPRSAPHRRFLFVPPPAPLNNSDILAHFFAASGLLPHDAHSSSSVADTHQLPIDQIASARTEFRAVAVAIDDPSTTDVDDAISYSPPHAPNAPCTLHIHIADVDRFIQSPSSPLFALLEQRASSAYFPGYHVPLLPAGLCVMSSLLPSSSLHPPHPHHQTNPCITISISVDAAGSISNITVAPHFLTNLVRLTYDVVDAALGTSRSSPTFRESWQRPASPLLAMPADPRQGFVYDSRHARAFQQLQAPASSSDDALTADLRNMLMAISSVAARMRARRKGGCSDGIQDDVDIYSEFQYHEPPSQSPSTPKSSPQSSSPSDVCGRLSSSTTVHPPSQSDCASTAASAAAVSPASPAAAAATTAPSTPPLRLTARYTVAELMIAACSASASWCRQRGVAVHYRSQRAPNMALAQLQRHAHSAFLSVAKPSLASAPTLPPSFPSAELLSVFAGKMATISGMQAAVNDVQPLQHHGIGADAYTQTTSPIRRFSDLLAQRQMKAALGFGESIAADRVQASLARQNSVRACIKRAERLLERRALLSVVRHRQLSVEDPSRLFYHGVVLRPLPPGKGSPGSFGDFAVDTALLPPSLMADFLEPVSHSPPARCAWFVMLIPALGALERVLLPLGTPPGTCIRAAAVQGSSVHGRIRFVRR